MKLLRLSMENFMPYKGKTSIVFPTDERRNVLIIFGDNMRGKTSLLNAIRWGFYEKALGRHLRELPLHELHNKEAGDEGDWNMEVRIEFEADGHQYNLLRRATKKAIVARPTRPEDFEVDVLLQKDSLLVSGQNVASEINRYVPEQVSRFFLFDGELLQEYEELLIEGSEQGKAIKLAIEQVLGVPTLINGRTDVGTVLRAAQKQQAKDLAHVSGLENQAKRQAELQVTLDSQEEDLARLLSVLADKKRERGKLEEELDKVDAVHRAKVQLDSVRQRQKDILTQQNDLDAERLSLMRDAWRDLLRHKFEVRRASLLEERNRISRLMERKSSLQSQAEGLRDLLETEKCPTCGQRGNLEDREKYGSELGLLEVQVREIEVTDDDLSEVIQRLKFVDKMLSASVAHKLESTSAQYRKLDVELTKLDNESDRLEEDVRGFDTAEIARKRQLRDGLLREEGALLTDINSVRRSIDTTNNQLAMVARALHSMPQARASASTSLVNLATSVERVFAESIEKLREKLRKHVQERASEAFQELTTQKTYSGLEINANFGLKILDETGADVAIRSAGAEQIVALSLIDGLARTGRSAGPVVMDTPFGRLDLKHRDNILKYLPTTTSQLVLLVHGGEIRRPRDLDPISQRIGGSYEIKEVNARHSKIERINL